MVAQQREATLNEVRDIVVRIPGAQLMCSTADLDRPGSAQIKTEHLMKIAVACSTGSG